MQHKPHCPKFERVVHSLYQTGNMHLYELLIGAAQ